MKHLLFVTIAVIVGYAFTLFCYMKGGAFVQPSLSLARLLFEDRGGESLLVSFTVINTVLSAIPIYVILRLMTRSRKIQLP